MDEGEHQKLRVTTTFSAMNWPTPDYVVAAKRARGKALREMILALFEWAKAVTTNGRSAETAITVPRRTAWKP